MDQIITRFPPSPTGALHLGGARTALFNWVYARHMGGKFVLRIEDTDTARSTPEAVQAIFDGLNWLGLDWDEGPFYQSRRFAVYAAKIEALINEGKAYYCTCTSERLEEMRKTAMARGEKPKYDGTCREKKLPATDDAVVRFKAPLAGQTVLKDIIKGHIVFRNDELDDFIIRRSDGTPTYNFVVVVDDIEMGINTILRGDDHVNNSPRQIQIYQALGADPPRFGHLPMVLGPDRTRLSKRHGATSVIAYRDMGILPDALLNYLVRLGWSYGDQEFFTREELIEKFNLENIGKSAGVFDMNKLLAINSEHIKKAPAEALMPQILPFLKNSGCETARADAFLEAAMDTMRPRSKTLIEMAEGLVFFYQPAIEYEPKAAQKFLKPAALAPLETLRNALAPLSEFSNTALEDAFKATMDQTDLKLGKIAQPVRVALTGKTVSPGIFEIIAVLGKTETLKRLAAAIDYVRQKQKEAPAA